MTLVTGYLTVANGNGGKHTLRPTNIAGSSGSMTCCLDFRIIVHSKDKETPPTSLTFVASSLQEKSAWCSDISQVMGVALLC